MTLDEMIAVLEAAKRGEKIEQFCTFSDHTQVWLPYAGNPFNFAAYDYRIAPKPEPKLVAHWPAICKMTAYFMLADLFVSEEDAKNNIGAEFIRLATEYNPIMLPVEE